MARVNMQVVLLEQKVADLQEEIANSQPPSETRAKFEIVKGENGTCKRCEAFVIANGVAIQKLKTLRAENAKLKSRI